jgi:hypothetical protein
MRALRQPAIMRFLEEITDRLKHSQTRGFSLETPVAGAAVAA